MKKLVRKALTNQKGLTLIELLAVVVILGIIAAIAVPTIGNIIQTSEQKAEVSEALSIISAAKIAHANNVPTADIDGGNGWSAGALESYISTNAGFSSVTFDGTRYTIHGHDNVVATEGSATESALANWLTSEEE